MPPRCRAPFRFCLSTQLLQGCRYHGVLRQAVFSSTLLAVFVPRSIECIEDLANPCHTHQLQYHTLHRFSTLVFVSYYYKNSHVAVLEPLTSSLPTTFSHGSSYTRPGAGPNSRAIDCQQLYTQHPRRGACCANSPSDSLGWGDHQTSCGCTRGHSTHGPSHQPWPQLQLRSCLTQSSRSPDA